MKTTNGIKKTQQLLADLQRCEFDLRAKQKLKAALKKLLAENSVRVLRSAAQEFPNDGMTLFYILAESHLALHTWPEKGLVNVDLFLCNYSRNNYHKAKSVMRELIQLLKPGKVIQHRVTRLN
ncbi:MAG: S-adenosylmethionine decarboxylase [Verrucomicrobiae bacterium]|nr:S-adenosylmethionine decarboxylase [Verrucomicrobiae bacterium]MCX7722500.1 S-adenosylmethionine decarboxylase [Verrucomicrobiae bacterium]MDW7980644.1 S-adenosylmethionine decarboxylase [Verrucomicrobiales bacterium]